MTSEAEAVLKEALGDTAPGKRDEEEFHDAEGDVNDLTRPSEWRPSEENKEEGESEEKPADEEVSVDSTGNPVDSRDYVDEAKLQQELQDLSSEEKEQKRLEANQYKLEGNNLYKEGKTSDAVDRYTAGLRVCPLSCPKERAVLYANRGQMKRVLGLNDQAIRNCSKAIELDPEYLKALLRRAEIYEETDKLDECLADYQKAVELDPKHLEANRALRRLPPMIEERNEKLKAEMFDNLKKLGNMVLNPFGLSTNNFKMEQDPATGGYNMQFVQNK